MLVVPVGQRSLRRQRGRRSHRLGVVTVRGTTFRISRSLVVAVVLVGDKVRNVFAQEELDVSTQLLDGVLDFVCELVLLNVQVEAVVHQRGRAFHKFHFTCIGRFLLLIGCDPRMFRLGGRYHASDIWGRFPRAFASLRTTRTAVARVVTSFMKAPNAQAVGHNYFCKASFMLNT